MLNPTGGPLWRASPSKVALPHADRGSPIARETLTSTIAPFQEPPGFFSEGNHCQSQRSQSSDM